MGGLTIRASLSGVYVGAFWKLPYRAATIASVIRKIARTPTIMEPTAMREARYQLLSDVGPGQNRCLAATR